MAIRLLESINTDDNPVAQNPDDGAVMNFLSAYKQNGRIWGAAVSWSGKIFTIAKGVLIARGYRILIDESTTLLDLTSAAMPSAQTSYSVIVAVTRVGHGASLAVSYTSGSYPTAAIDQVEGSYALKIGTLVLGPAGVVGFTDSMATVSPPSGGSSGSLGSSIPTPILEIASARSGGAYGGYLCLKNKGDYNGYAATYSVRFKLYRFVGKGKYRERSGSTKVYIQKSSWVLPAVSLGWSASRKIPNVTLLGDLGSATITTNGTLSYSRNDVMSPVADIVQSMFYDASGAKAAVTASSNVYSIRSTGSKKRKVVGQYGKHAKHNYFIFAYRAFLYSGTEAVASSAMSRAVVIAPNYRMKTAAGAGTGLAGKFRILIE